MRTNLYDLMRAEVCGPYIVLRIYSKPMSFSEKALSYGAYEMPVCVKLHQRWGAAMEDKYVPHGIQGDAGDLPKIQIRGTGQESGDGLIGQRRRFLRLRRGATPKSQKRR